MRTYTANLGQARLSQARFVNLSSMNRSPWLHHLPAASLPSEIHLSHNRMTPRGFDAVVQAIEAKWAQQLFGKRTPVWLRVEGNPIDDTCICALVMARRAVFAAKCSERSGDVALSFPAFHGKQMQSPQGQMPQQSSVQPISSQTPQHCM